MFIFRQSADLQAYLKKERLSGKKSGFVPTMGALHEAHLSLVRRARGENELTVCSIFVNPTQFNDPKDYELYPKTVEKDIYLLEKAACDVLFLPDIPQIYPPGVPQNETYELGHLESALEGKYRPGHFQGVCQVMRRLLQLVEPDRLYIGQKDYQQCLVIKKLLTLLKMQIEVIICPTLRESNGLAMSSRNLRLSDEEKERSAAIFDALTYMNSNIKEGCLKELLAAAKNMLLLKGLQPDYVEIAATDDLRLLEAWNGQARVVALVAAYMGKVRLIDNMVLPLNFAGYAN
ncbi:MAG: pantoate--beta-alanine ligase [Chitinophagaceae bacterium]|nr:pantoate--beta-alanine ligase [Chitinophagaceae bacterium]